MKTPIEVLCEILMKSANVSVGEILIPEQCAEVFVGDAHLHITCEPMPS